MMTYPPYHSRSGNAVSETLENLVQIRRSLLELFRESNAVESSPVRHSLFSSKRNYRSDEFYQGLTPAIASFGFSKN